MKTFFVVLLVCVLSSCSHRSFRYELRAGQVSDFEMIYRDSLSFPAVE